MAPELEKTDEQETRREAFPALPPRLRPGETLGHYRIRLEIARGATATVYRARNLRTDVEVALKVLSADLGVMPAAVERFRTEAELAARARGPGVVTIYELGVSRDHNYYAMELQSGATAHRLKGSEGASRADSHYRRICLLFAGAASTLERIHRAGIVHRDVKPGNLLLDRSGRLLLCDFGSALGTRRGPASSAPLWGTVRYLSPDQFVPGADPHDPRIDVYALGVTVFEILTGTPLFPRCRSEEMVALKLTGERPAPHLADTRLPLGLDAIIRQATEAEPSLRYPTAGALAEELERFATLRRGHKR